MICFVLCGGIVCGAIYVHDKNLPEDAASGTPAEIAEYNQLDARKNQIERKISALKTSSDRKTLGKGTVSIVCVGAHKKAYSIVYQELKKRDYKAVLVLTDEFFVGGSDCLTVEQFTELTEAGWEVALLFSPKNDDPIGSLESLRTRAEKLGIDSVTSVYVPPGEYSASYDAELLKLGFNAVINTSKSVHSVSVDRVGSSGEKLWMTYALAYSSTTRAAIFTDLEDKGGMYSFDISFDSSYIGSYCTDYSVKSFVTACAGCNSEKVQFLTLSEARKYFEGIEASGGISTDDEEQEIARLEKELADIENKLKELFRKIEN